MKANSLRGGRDRSTRVHVESQCGAGWLTSQGYPALRPETCWCHSTRGERLILVSGWLAAGALAGMLVAGVWLWGIS